MKFLSYSPDQIELLPPSAREVLGEDHLCFFVRRVVARLNLSAIEQAYSEEGQPGYHPALLVSVWLYAYARGSPARGGWSNGFGKTWRFAIWRPGRSRISGR